MGEKIKGDASRRGGGEEGASSGDLYRLYYTGKGESGGGGAENRDLPVNLIYATNISLGA